MHKNSKPFENGLAANQSLDKYELFMTAVVEKPATAFEKTKLTVRQGQATRSECPPSFSRNRKPFQNEESILLLGKIQYI